MSFRSATQDIKSSFTNITYHLTKHMRGLYG